MMVSRCGGSLWAEILMSIGKGGVFGSLNSERNKQLFLNDVIRTQIYLDSSGYK